MSDSTDTRPVSETKREWHAPKLVALGDAATLTNASSAGADDGTGSS